MSPSLSVLLFFTVSLCAADNSVFLSSFEDKASDVNFTCYFNIDPTSSFFNWTNGTTYIANLTSFAQAQEEAASHNCSMATITVFPGITNASTFAAGSVLQFLQILGTPDMNFVKMDSLSLRFAGPIYANITNLEFLNTLNVTASLSYGSALDIRQVTTTDADVTITNISDVTCELFADKNVHISDATSIFLYGSYFGDYVNVILSASSSISVEGVHFHSSVSPMDLQALEVHIRDSFFSENMGEEVGALLIKSQYVEIWTSQFSNNSASHANAKSPAIYIDANDVMLSLVSTNFSCNNASEFPGQPPLAIRGNWTPGDFHDNFVAAQCPFSCPLGEFSFHAIINCAKCARGSASNITTALNCTACIPGFYAPDEGQHECSACPDDTYTNSTGSDRCFPCPEGSTSNGSATSCSTQPAPGCDVWRSGDGCAALSSLSYGLLGGGIGLGIIIVIAIVLVVRKKPDARGDYTRIRDE